MDVEVNSDADCAREQCGDQIRRSHVLTSQNEDDDSLDSIHAVLGEEIAFVQCRDRGIKVELGQRFEGVSGRVITSEESKCQDAAEPQT